MKNERLLNAFGEIEERFITEAAPQVNQLKKSKKGRKTGPVLRFFRKPAAVAAVIAVAVILAVPVSAEIANGYVSNLLAPLYGGVQTELVDQIGRPIEASAVVGDYRLTADAIIGDKYNIAIVYSLTRTDGGQLEEGISFENHSNSAPRGSSGGSYAYYMNKSKTVLSMVETYTSANRFRLNKMVTAKFTDLIRYDPETREKKLIEEGEWELKFTLRYEDASVKVPVADTVVEDISGNVYTVHKIVISPIGIHMDLTAPNPGEYHAIGIIPYRDFTLSLILDGGGVENVEEMNFSMHGKTDADTHEATMGAMFDVPVPLDQIREILVCGTPFVLGD